MRVRLPAANCRELWPIVAGLLISLAGCNAERNRVVKETFEQAYAIEPNANVTIRNGDGAILLYGSPGNQMHVHAVKKAYARARLTQIAIDVSANAGSVSIATRFPPKQRWGLSDRSGTVDYTIVVPATANISQVSLDAGEILLEGLEGQTTRARLGDGRMFIRNSFTSFDIAIRRGNLSALYDWWEKSIFSAQARIEQGNAWAYFPVDAGFHLVAQTEHGDVRADFQTEAVAASVLGGGMALDVPVNGGGDATLKFHVRNGNIGISQANR